MDNKKVLEFAEKQNKELIEMFLKSDITYEEFKEANFKSTPLIEEADRLMLFYKKSEKEYMVRELKNNFTETPQWFSRPSVFDIRDLLN